MIKNGLKFISLVSASFIATSCSLFSTKHYDWLIATKNNTEINYCLLIGQNEHSDSIERTRATRNMFGTRNEKTEVNGNANLGDPKTGYIELGEGDAKTGFTVHEIEHMEQKSLAGVPWDPITANASTATWICKHGKNITAIISNNDGMAEGALAAPNWIEGLPIFGYDANESTIKKIYEGKIAGTVDQNAASQTAALCLLARNILDDENDSSHKIGTEEYNPLETDGKHNRGFNGDGSDETLRGFYINGYGTEKWNEEKTLDEIGGIVNPYENDPNNMKLNSNGAHAILSRSFEISLDDVENFIDEKGEVKKPKELAYGGYVIKSDFKKPEKSYNICFAINSKVDPFLQGTIWPYMQVYANDLNLNLEKIDGDGVNESSLLNQIESSDKKFDAYMINMTTTTDGGAFVYNYLSKKAIQKEHPKIPQDIPESKGGGWSKWENRLDTPVIFWNKQPMTVKGEVDTSIMNNNFFKYTYYVGVDNVVGGLVQSELIKGYLNYLYLNSMGAK